MYAATIERKELLQSLGARGGSYVRASHVNNLQHISSPKAGRILLIWRNDPSEIWEEPVVIVAGDSEIQEFLAWVSTYLAEYRPVTSFFRLFSSSEFELWQRPPPPANRSATAASVGLILGEACLRVVRGGRPLDVGSLSLGACSSTLSFVLGRTISAGYGDDFLEASFRAWERTCVVSGQSDLVRDSRDFLGVWQLASLSSRFGFSLTSVDSSRQSPSTAWSQDILTEFLRNQDLSSRSFGRMGGLIGALGISLLDMEGPREGRVAALERVIAAVRDSRLTPNPEDAMTLGFLANRVSPGTFEHVPLLQACASTHPASLLWYGLFAGLSPNAAVGNFCRGLGRWVLRELDRIDDVLQRPVHDIAFRELDMLSAGSPASLEFRAAQRGYLQVEVLPMVRLRVNWGKRDTIPYDQNRELLPGITRGMEDHVLGVLTKVVQDIESLQRFVGGPPAKVGGRGRGKK